MLSELGPFLFEKSRLVQQLLSWTSFARPSVMSLAFPQDGLSAFGIPRHLLWTPETGPGRGSSGVAGCVHLWMAEFLKCLVQWLPIHTLLGLQTSFLPGQGGGISRLPNTEGPSSLPTGLILQHLGSCYLFGGLFFGLRQGLAM